TGEVWVLFFFSSRRRHTRFSRDWSSDVCSSDLQLKHAARILQRRVGACEATLIQLEVPGFAIVGFILSVVTGEEPFIETKAFSRSEERRVGKECRSSMAADA